MQGRETAKPGAELARSYIQQRFLQIGLQPLSPDYRQSFSYSAGFTTKQGVNMVAQLKSCQQLPGQADAYIVMTAHYDHLGVQAGKVYNGADDNASGVATMLALASLLKHQHCAKYNYLFIATDAEEGGLYGSKAFVASPLVPLPQILLNINLDMLSRGERQNKLYLYGAFSLPGVADYVKSQSFALKLQLRHRGKGLRGQYRVDWANASDHAPFRRAGLPFLFFGVDNHAQYHTAEDDWQKIRPAYIDAMFATVSSMLLWLDQQPPQWYRAARRNNS
jgi:Zn-dependent M28 family amino/carboxypeptidase